MSVALTRGGQTVLTLRSSVVRRPALSSESGRLAVEASGAASPCCLADLWLLEEP